MRKKYCNPLIMVESIGQNGLENGKSIELPLVVSWNGGSYQIGLLHTGMNEWRTSHPEHTKSQKKTNNIGEGETRHDKKHQEQERKKAVFPEIIVNILFIFFVPVFFALKGKRIYPTLTSTLTMHRPTKHRPDQICSSTTTGGRASSEGRTEGRRQPNPEKTYNKRCVM